MNFKNRSKEKFIFHSSYYRTSNSKNAINIITVYDFIYEKFSSGWRKKIHTWQKERAINNSHHIICISHSTKNDLLTYYPAIMKSKITVVYLGASDTFKENNKLKKEKSLIFVGSRGIQNLESFWMLLMN